MAGMGCRMLSSGSAGPKATPFCLPSVPSCPPCQDRHMNDHTALDVVFVLMSLVGFRAPIPSHHQMFRDPVAMRMSDVPGCYGDTVAMVMQLLCLAEAGMDH